MNTTVWILIGTFLLVTYTISFMAYQKARSARERKQDIPFFTAMFIGPAAFLCDEQQSTKRKKAVYARKTQIFLTKG